VLAQRVRGQAVRKPGRKDKGEPCDSPDNAATWANVALQPGLGLFSGVDLEQFLGHIDP
jgi:hypothetical protein